MSFSKHSFLSLEPTVCRCQHNLEILQISNFTRQKMVMIAKQRSDLLREEYVMVFRGHLVFVDEAGANRIASEGSV